MLSRNEWEKSAENRLQRKFMVIFLCCTKSVT